MSFSILEMRLIKFLYLITAKLNMTHRRRGFSTGCDVIAANRWSDELADVANKVHTRDLFKRD